MSPTFQTKFFHCFYCIVLVLLGCISVGSIDAQPNSKISSAISSPTTRFRLPSSLHPLKYYLRLFVVLDPLPEYQRFTAKGNLLIHVACSESTNQIYLHSTNLTIFHDSIKVVSQSSGSNLGVRNLTFDILNDFLIISLNDSLRRGEDYAVNISFVAPIPNYRLNGMYQDNYTDPITSETRFLATTLFAPYHARRLYPCFDEPSFRAEYEVVIGHHQKYHAMSNEDFVSTRPDENIADYMWTTFKTTPNISSYISAMIVSDFTFEEAIPNNFPNKTVRVYASPHLISKGAGEYAANITDAVMGFFEDRFIVKYPLQKLYSVALPHFFFSAMENLGAITYKEPVLLYLKNETTEEERYTINSVMSHELAHQWFGNIVACKWWAYVWLKEGFATFYSYYGMNHTNPELKPWEMFVPKSLQVAMIFDASNATHPLENFPATSEAVAGIYTSIPYQKGASILRMTSTFLTETVFEQAIKVYVGRYQYKSAEQNDLFDILQETLDQYSLISTFIPASVKEIMNSWCQQSRFPLISVSRINFSQIQLNQEEFSDEGPTNSSKTWWIPINLDPRSKPDLPGTVPDAWIPKNTSSIVLEVLDGETVIVNPEAIGYYRVKYDASLTREILKKLNENHLQISPVARSKLIDDYFQMAFAGYLPLESAMEFTKYLGKETSTGVWFTVQETMNTIFNLLWQIIDYDSNVLLQDYLLSKINEVWNALEQSNSDQVGSIKILKEMFSKWSCDLDQCIDLRDEDVKNFVKNPKQMDVPADKQFILYCSAMKQDSRDRVLMYVLDELYNPNTLFGRKQRLLNALTCITDWDNLKWLLLEIFGGNRFVTNESHQLLKLLAKKHIPAKFILQYFKRFPEEVLKKYGDLTVDLLVDILEVTDVKEWQTPEAIHLLNQVDMDIKCSSKAKFLRSRLARSKKRQSILMESNLLKWLQTNSY